jgi:hypothetical protein
VSRSLLGPLFFFEGDGDSGVRRKPDAVALYIGDETFVDVVRVSLVGTQPAVVLFVSLMRRPAIASTVPTWTPSAPITFIPE